MPCTIDPAEKKRLQKMTLHEKQVRKQGYKLIVGIDEAGRGPLAGPVVAAACLLPKGFLIPGVDDSKKLTPLMRERLFEELSQDKRIIFGVGVVHHDEIDRINIYQATIAAMLQAVSGFPTVPDFLLVDGLNLPHPTIPSMKIIGGDGLSLQIAAASICAKVTRDRLMHEYHQQWPEYGFASHKGYGTAYHVEAIRKFGPCPIHRRSFEPIKSMLA